MELTVAQVAKESGRSDRFVQLAIASGALTGHRRHGRMVTVDDIAARAWGRSLGRGRQWTAAVRTAALDLLSDGFTGQLQGSQLSRLKSRLRSMSAAEIAHAAGGLGTWARFRGDDHDGLERIGPSVVDRASLGLVAGNDWLTFVRTDDLDRLDLLRDLTLDADGNVGVVQRAESDDRVGRALLDTYLLGDARQSAAAGAELRRRAAAL